MLASGQSGVTSFVVGTVAALVVRKLSHGPAPGSADTRKFTIVQAGTMAVSDHRFLPIAGCPVCGTLPDDSRSQAEIVLQPRTKAAPKSFRTRDLNDAFGTMRSIYVDPEAGVVQNVRFVGMGTFPCMEARVGLAGRSSPEAGWGRAFDLQSARVTAVAEALERLGGWRPIGKRTRVRGTYKALKGSALDPASVGLYPSDRFAEPDFPLVEYHQDLEIPWVWGFSFRRGAAILVPERLAYYGPSESGERSFVHEVSNGCAVGTCLEEAILHGILEVAERDGFLMSWWARMPVPQVDPATARDPLVQLMIERIARATGYETLIFSTMLEQRIPSFWVMAIDSADRPGFPKAICTGGASINPEKGVISGLHELGPLIDGLPNSYAHNLELVERMAIDSFSVREMAHHVLLYSHPSTFGRFDFLLRDRRTLSFAEIERKADWPDTQDLRDDVVQLVERYVDTGLDVIVVDQTGPEHRLSDISCVKIIIPGTLPITFGHSLRRTHDLPRLRTIPHELGYRATILNDHDLNEYPHPFP
jgi:ribosomal protein S12 methylthiotransferase accessory factor